MILAGADVHDKSILVKVAVGRGEPEVESWPNDVSGRRRLLKSLVGRARRAGAVEIHFAYEASSVGFGLYDELSEAGVNCSVLAPTKIRKSVQERRRKTDEKDAERILEVLRGHVLAGNGLPAVWVPDMETRDDRELVRTRLEISSEITSLKTKIQMLLKRNGPRAPKEAGESWTVGYWGWLEGLMAEGSDLGFGAREALKSLVERLRFHEEHCSGLDRAVRKLSKTERYRDQVKELVALKGVGLLTAMVFLAEMGDLRRFSNRREVGAYLGLVPAANESGEAADRKGRITKEGSSRVRRVLCQATWARVRTDVSERRFYRRIVDRNPKRKKKAVVASMRRLAIRMWHAGMRAAPAGCGSASPTSSAGAHSRRATDPADASI
jgi:transposase